MRKCEGLEHEPKDTLCTRKDPGVIASKAPCIEPTGDVERRDKVRTKERKFPSQKRGANLQRSQAN